MNIEPTTLTSPAVSTQGDRTIRVVEKSDSPSASDAFRDMVRTNGVSSIERPSGHIVKPPEINDANVSLQFGVDAKTGDRVIKMIDEETGEVIRQIPPEELLHVMQTLRALKGLLLSTKL